MTELESLLAAVKDRPGDDTPRLVLADWLDEHESRVKKCSGQHRHKGRRGEVIHGVLHEGNPRNPHHHCDEKCWVPGGFPERAELIRVGCELERVKAQPGWVPSEDLWHHDAAVLEALFRLNNHDREKKIEELRRREHELLGLIAIEKDQGAVARNYELAPGFCIGSHIASFSRGFLSRVHCSSDYWLAHGDAILADPWTPGLDEVELTTWGDMTARADEEFFRSRWPDVRKWTLPPNDGGFRVPDEFTPELLRRLGEIMAEFVDREFGIPHHLAASRLITPSSPQST